MTKLNATLRSVALLCCKFHWLHTSMTTRNFGHRLHTMFRLDVLHNLVTRMRLDFLRCRLHPRCGFSHFDFGLVKLDFLLSDCQPRFDSFYLGLYVGREDFVHVLLWRDIL